VQYKKHVDGGQLRNFARGSGMKRKLSAQTADAASPDAPAVSDAPATDVAQHLQTLASALSWGAERRAAARAAEEHARAELIQRLKAMPPQQCFSPAALASFKKQHAAMMTFAPRDGGGAKTPPPG
jgi:hypothetical protein